MATSVFKGKLTFRFPFASRLKDKGEMSEALELILEGLKWLRLYSLKSFSLNEI